ncbi:MAG TPA: hypothetical protein VFB19_18640 [Mycobacterium sp.]|nr:hypothetical protein [Mycobacterium sp.]
MTGDGLEHVALKIQTIRRVQLALIGLVLLQAIGLIVLGLFVLGRSRHAAQTAENNRVGTCVVLNSIPPRLRTPPVLEAMRLDHCANVRRPSPRPSPSRHAQSEPSPSLTVVVVPASPPSPRRSGVVQPRPSRSPSPHRTPSPSRSPSPSPSPTPSSTPTCDLRHPLKCLPTLGAT